MNRQSFKERMKSLKSYREENPGKGYWDWKVLAFGDGGDVELAGEKEIQWFKDWYNKRMEYAIANNRPDIVKQLGSLQYYFYPEQYKYSLDVPWDNSIYTATLEPKINKTKISINDQAIKDYEKEHGIKIGGYLHPAEGIVLPSNYSSSDLLHELAHVFNSSESVTNAVNAAISDENGFVSFSKGLQNPEYWVSPWEVHSRLMQFRKENNIDPIKVYSEEDIKQLRKSAKDETLFEIFDDSQMMHLLNDVAYNATTSTDDRLFLKNGGVVPAYGDGTGSNDDPRVQIINRANEVASNYDNAKDFDLNSVEYSLRKLAKNWFGRGGISNCTLSATGWIDPNNQYMSARNIFNNPNSGYVEIDKEYALPGDLLISKNPEKDSYHTMLIEGFNDNEPLLRYSRGGHDTEENLVKSRPLTEYHRLDNEQGGNHTEDHYFRYMLPNEFWLPEVTIFSDKVNVPAYGDGGDIDLNTAAPKASQEQIDTELSNALLHSIRKGHKDSIKTFMSRGEYIPEPYTYPDAGNIDYAFNLLDVLPTPNLGIVGKISNNLGLKHMMNYRKYGIKSKYWDELDNILKLADKDGIQIPGDRLEWALKQTENFKKFAGDDYIEGYMGIRNPFDPKWVGRKWIASKDRALGYTWSKKQVMKEGDVGIVPVVTPKPKNIKEYNAQGRNWTNVDGYKSTDELAGSGSVKYTNVRDDGPHTLRDVAETEYTFPFDHPTKVIVGNNGDFNPHINDMYGVVKNESGQFNPLPLTLAIQQKRAEQKEKQKKNKKRSN